MTPEPPVSLRITAHHTPHQTDPANAKEFYATLGMLVVAWGRLEGHVIGNLLTLMNSPELAPAGPLPFAWDDRLKLWTKAFSVVPALQPHRERAVLFLKSIIDEVVDRNFVSHAVWDEFVSGATEPSIDARNIKARKGRQNLIDVGDIRVTLTMLEKALAAANRLNFAQSEFTNLISRLRPPPSVTPRL
jgi:hypothetical protein